MNEVSTTSPQVINTLSTPPAKYSTDDVLKIINLYKKSTGSLKKLCIEQGFDFGAIWDAIYDQNLKRDNPQSLYWIYQQARTERSDAMVDECNDIADTNDREAAHQSNRIKSRQWIASKLNSKVYGDKQQVELSGSSVQVFIPARPDSVMDNTTQAKTEDTEKVK